MIVETMDPDDVSLLADEQIRRRADPRTDHGPLE
jgi:hypothetical protein